MPEAEIQALAAGAPPMVGGEYLDTAALAACWEAMSAACRAELAEFDGPLEAFLRSRHAAWHVVGRVHFHLAENRADPAAPFAFLATYSTRLTRQGKAQHRPLGEAIREYAGAGNRDKLLALLEPVQIAAARSPLLRELVDSGDVYRPLGLTPDDAYRFLRDIPAFEASGVVVRVPDWWAAKRPPRPQVQVTLGARAPGGVGTDALLDFDVRVTLDGQTLTAAEIARVASSSAGLALIRGKWVELDAARLNEALAHWKRVEAAAGEDGLSFIEGMRLLSGAAVGSGAAPPPPDAAPWSEVMAGPWLKEALDGLRGPEGLGEAAAAPRAPRRAEAVSGGGRALALAPAAAGTRRLPGRRHGARQDRAGPGAPARAEGARRRRARSRPARGPGIADRQLEGRDRPVRAVPARARRPSVRGGQAPGRHRARRPRPC